MKTIKSICPYCNTSNEFITAEKCDAIFCQNCGKKFAVEDGMGVKLSSEKITMDFSEIEQAETKSSKSDRITVSFEPHVQTKVAGRSSSSIHRSNISDLRNQVTMVSTRDQQTILAGKTSSTVSVNTQERVHFSLPFTVGNFLATEVLAQGGMSITYLGHISSAPSQKVVIKIPDITSAKTVSMFRDECKILESLQHQNIVPILDSGSIVVDGQDFPYMVMKFIDGQSLRQQLKTKGQLSWNEAKAVLDDVATALGYLYINNFCHRDIKPDNIIFDTETKKWILVDFGIAKSLQDNITLTMTIAGQDSGTWDYMSPEQLDGKSVDIRCDIYALGTVIWESLIGTVPRRGTKLPAAYGIDLPEDVDILIGKMVEHDPANRYQTPAEVLDALHKGAKRVEIWKNVKQKTKKISRITLYSLLITIFLIISWLVGDFVVIAKSKVIYESKKDSATIALREINKFAGKMPFYWGRRYISSIRPDLEKKAAIEEKKMRTEYDNIKDKICIHTGSDQELEDRLLLCNNFLIKWDHIFNTAELREAHSNKEILDSILLQHREEKLVADTIAESRKKTAGKEKSKYQEALAQCRRVLDLLKFPDMKKKMGDHIATLRQEAAGEALEEVDILLASHSREDWFTAYKKINEIRSTIGDEQILIEKQRSIDDKFWAHYFSEAQKAVATHRFTNAREYIAFYEKTGMTAHKGDVISTHAWINQKEEEYDWNNTRETADKYMNDKAFSYALDALLRFEKKYPNSKIDIEKNKKIISDNYVAFIIDKRTDFESYQENMKVYLDKFPVETENIKKLKRFLCWSVHNYVGEIIYNDTIVSQAKNAQLAQIKYHDCENYQRDYLRHLIAAAQNYATENSLSNRYEFQYYHQRPPADCVKMNKSPTIFYVTITEVKVSLSHSHYNELRGMNNCNPEIRIGKEGYEPWWKIAGPENTYTFTLNKTYNFWWDIEDKNFEIQIADGDGTPFDASTYRDTLEPSAFKQSNNTSWKWDNGTILEMSWTTK